MESRENQEHVLHFSLPARVASFMLPSLALFAQKLVDVALRRHGAFLHCSGNIHDLLLVGLLLRLLRLVMRHWRVVITIHAGRRRWLLGLRLMLLLLLLLLLLGIHRGLVVQRRVQREVVAAHGGSGRRSGAASQ
jgi:hypothetical protein